VNPGDLNVNTLQVEATNAAADQSVDPALSQTRYSIDSRRVPTDALNRKHPEWALYSRTWDDLCVLYDGGTVLKNEASRFLRERPKELKEIYQARLAGFTYQNILGTGLGWYLGKLFETDPAIDIKISGRAIEQGDPEWAFYDGFFENCDLSGTSFFNVAREIYRQALLYRCCFVILDLPESVNTADNRAEQDEELKPYLVLRDPRTAINWSVDAYGNLQWIVFATSTVEPGFLNAPVTVSRWTYYDRTEYRVYEQRSDARQDQAAYRMADLIASGRHAMADAENPDGTTGRVPVVMVEVPKGLWLAERVMLQVIDHLNTENALKWGLLLGCLAQPYIKTDGEMQPTVSESSMLQLRPGDEFGWMEPSGKSFQIAAERLQCLREEIYRAMYLQAQGRTSAATASAASGYSKELDMAPAADVLNAFGKIMRDALQQILYSVAAIRGDSTMDFDIRGLSVDDEPMIADLTVAEQIQAFGIQSDTFLKEVQKSLVRNYGASWNRDLLDVCCAEIDEAPTQSEIEAAQQEADQKVLDQKMQLATARLVTKNSNDQELAA
jgi:hypothetical protein